MGGSIAEGYPYTPLGSFSRYIRRRLELVYPETHIEVVNISMTAVGTYTILDLIRGVLDQKPDLILIYAGHNEYYGALGVGSEESLGSSPALINLMLNLDNFKVTQLVRNSVRWFISLFSSGRDKNSSQTLMSRMVKDKYILLNSGKFEEGLKQFRDNLKSILSLIKDKGVPVILGRLVSNLKDQKPFVSIYTPNYGTADQVYKEAKAELTNNNISKPAYRTDRADSLFKLAKDLDALRFRAPEKMNAIIDNLGKEYNVKIAPVDSVFDSYSPDGIVGDNLIVDHLHPNIRGNQLMGKAFYDVMERSGYLPEYEKPAIPYAEQDSVTRANFMFTKLDSSIGDNIIALLKNDWPFVESKPAPYTAGKDPSTENLYIKGNFIDSIASEFMGNKLSWADAHLKAATVYLRRNDIKEYLKYMNVLIYQYPNLKNLRTALKYFYERHKINPRDYTIKRLGIIALYNKNYTDAIRNLTMCYKSDPDDTLVLYSLAEGYFRIGKFDIAESLIKKCLKINPHYPGADNLKRQISDSAGEHSIK